MKCLGCKTVSWINEGCKNKYCSRECESFDRGGKSMPIKYRRDVFNPWLTRALRTRGEDEDVE